MIPLSGIAFVNDQKQGISITAGLRTEIVFPNVSNVALEPTMKHKQRYKIPAGLPIFQLVSD